MLLQLLGENNEQAFLPWGLAAAAGAMLFVIVDEIIPEIDRESMAQEGTLGIMTSDPDEFYSSRERASVDGICCHDVFRHCFWLTELLIA